MAQLELAIPHSMLGYAKLGLAPERAYCLHASRAHLGFNSRESSRLRHPRSRRTLRCEASEPTSGNSSGEPDATGGKSSKDWGADSGASSSRPSSDANSSNGPRLTQWGGSVRGGKYQMGEGTDTVLGLWGNGEVMLFAALVLLSLFCVLLNFIPAAPQ